ncbi:putative sugar transporter [Aspergillus steynii IBT 23096]|uniref:Putative sugar transporter n=1 Tax=Aspergillus steynii IBT 23096 TaxID=1392250 RepID=A0A2I2GAY2_9EURO|nr:putative sugar transporter [Aspergillus steynii IBT 23096]PLB50041.1 putative sugar transporter [Aspergillus steynii IBT 23096]
MGASGGGWSNEAIRRVPTQARGTYIWLAVIWASYCGGLHGFNTANISGTMSLKPFVRDFGWTELSDVTISDYSGWVVSSMLLGQTAGVLVSGPLGERRGRKSVIMGSAILYTIGAILMAANFGSLAELLVGRVLSGLGSGFGMTVGPIYISEVAPTEMRGMMTTFYNINIMAGVAGSYWINYASLEVIPATDSWQWRTTLVLQLIPAIALFVGFPFFPESPRYLMLRGEEQAAHDSLSRLRGLDSTNPYFTREYNELKARMITSSESQSALQSFKSLLASCITHPPTRKLLLFVTIIQTFFIMSGGNSITYYAPTILKSIGLDSTQVLLFSAVYGLIKLISVLLYAFILTDRFGRRPLLLIGSTLNVICLTYLSAYLGLADLSSTGSPSPAAWIAIVAICIFAIGYGIGWAPAFSLTASEICPTPVRGTVVTLAFVYQNLLNFGITRGFPNMTVSMQAWGPFALFAAFTGLATGWVFVAFPECKGRSMESADQLFSLPWWRIGFVRVPSGDSNGDRDGDGGWVYWT